MLTCSRVLHVLAAKMVKAAGTSKGGYLEAERWLQRMEDANLKPGKIEYTELINCAGKARDLKAAEALTQLRTGRLDLSWKPVKCSSLKGFEKERERETSSRGKVNEYRV